MLRVRITVSFLVLTILMVVVTNLVIGQYKSERAIKIEREIESSNLSYARLKQLRDLRIKGLAQQIATSDIAAALSVLDVYRSTMNQVEKQLQARFKRVEEPGEESLVMTQRMEFLKSDPIAAPFRKLRTEFASSLALKTHFSRGKGAWRTETKAAFTKRAEDMLTRCL